MKTPQKRWIVRPGWQAWSAVVGVLWFAVVAGLFSGVMLHEIDQGSELRADAGASAPAVVMAADSLDAAGSLDPADSLDSVQAADSGFTVQVGVFEDYANAERLIDTLHHDHDRVRLDKRSPDLFVVSLGPFDDKAGAIEMARQIQTGMDISPIIHEPTVSEAAGEMAAVAQDVSSSDDGDSGPDSRPEAPVATESAEASIETPRPGFSVQVGVFRSYENAKQLADALKANHEQVHFERRPPDLYVVSLGPFEDRAAALEMAQRIKAELNIAPYVRESEPVQAQVEAQEEIAGGIESSASL